MALDSAKTPTDLIGLVRDSVAALRAREVELLLLALAWADAHPDPEADQDNRRLLEREESAMAEVADPDHDHDPDHDPRVPAVSWSAGAPFAAAMGVSTASGEAMIRDGLVLRHRLPEVFARVLAGEVQVWRARRIAQAVAGRPEDVAAHLDKTIAPVAEKVGPVILDRLIDEAMMRLYPEERELAQQAALDSRYVKVEDDPLNETGVGYLSASADWKDLRDLDQTLSALATALKEQDTREGRPTDTHQVRRSRALGVLADPETAAAILAGAPAPAPKKRALLVLRLNDHTGPDTLGPDTLGPDTLGPDTLGLNPDVVARNDTTSAPVLEQLVRSWCGRTDTHLTVLPIRDLADHESVERYEISDRLTTKIELLTPTCVFPWCTRPARSCDKDHTIAYHQGGTTCDCNLAPLCRRHHRLKTTAGWHYQTIETGVWLWTDPHGQQFLRNHQGTTDTTPPHTREGPPEDTPPPHGCRRALPDPRGD